MKKHLFTLIAAMLIITGCNKTKQFTVTLNLDNADNKTVYLSKDVDGKTVGIDTAVFAGKTAVLTAPYDDPQTSYIIQFDKNEKCGSFQFFTENQNTTITGICDEKQRWTVKGCPVMDEYNAYRETFLPMEDEMMALFNEANDLAMAGDTVKGEEIMKQIYSKMDEYNNQQLDYYRSHGDSYLTHFFVDQEKEQMEYEVLKELSNSFTTESIYSKRINDYIAEHAKVEVGAPFIDFTLKTADGQDVNLGETIKNNKLTLVDFWASWCGPCRGENPFVKAAYEKYHAKGFEIVGVSVDRDEAAWLKAVADDGMTWIQVRDADNSAGTDYMVMFIPSNFLYDENGVMIAKGLRGEALEAKLAEVLQ